MKKKKREFIGLVLGISLIYPSISAFALQPALVKSDKLTHFYNRIAEEQFEHVAQNLVEYKYESSTFILGYKPVLDRSEHALVLLVEFEDGPRLRYSKDDFQERLFERENSLTNYYKTESNGEYNLSGEVIGPFTVPYSKSYNDSPASLILFSIEALLEQQEITISDFDQNFDNVLDLLIVIFAGQSAQFSSSADIPTRWTALSGTTEVSIEELLGIEVDDFVTVSELGITKYEMTGIGPFAHEIGHHFGLPDLYDEHQNWAGVGKWDLMGYGGYGGKLEKGLFQTRYYDFDAPVSLSGWTKALLGWIDVIEIKNSQRVKLKPVKNENIVLKIPFSTRSESEYFLVEFRTPVGNDRDLPLGENGGLLIWHVDWDPASYKTNNHENKGECGQYYSQRPILALEQADGKFQMEEILGLWNYGDENDVFPGKKNITTFGQNQKPYSNNYDCNAHIQISNIIISNNEATFDVTL